MSTTPSLDGISFVLARYLVFGVVEFDVEWPLVSATVATFAHRMQQWICQEFSPIYPLLAWMDSNRLFLIYIYKNIPGKSAEKGEGPQRKGRRALSYSSPIWCAGRNFFHIVKYEVFNQEIDANFKKVEKSPGLGEKKRPSG